MEKSKKVSDQTKSLLIRMWFAGIVCLFVAWTPIGGGEAETNAFVFQMIFMLALFLFLTNIIVVNPVIRGMFKTKLDYTQYFSQSPLLRSAKNLGHFAKMACITILIWASYILINIILGWMGFSSINDRPIIMLEPITFGFLYGLYYYIFESIQYRIYLAKQSKESK